MAVNESVYGLKENWVIRNITGSAYGANVPDDEKLKIANFLNTQSLTPSSDDRLGMTLGNAIYKMVNTPTWTINGEDGLFDKSIIFTAMSGRHCPYTTLRVLTNIRPEEASDNNYPITELEPQHIDIVNWSFSAAGWGSSYSNGINYYSIFKSDVSGHEANANRNYDIRWSPNPHYGTQSSGTYTQFYTLPYSGRNRTTFVTQLPCRRHVLVPYITCSTNSDTGVQTVDLNTYITTLKATKPRIISIGINEFNVGRDSDIPTQSNQRVLSLTYGLILHHTIDALNGYYCDVYDTNSKTLIDNNFFVPVCRTTPYLPIGGAINSGNTASTKPDGITYRSPTDDTFHAYVYVNCGDLAWNMWSGDGDGLTGKGEYLYCDATAYTDEQIIDSVRRAVACFGMFFADSEANAKVKALDDSGIFLGTLVDGVGYGDYTEGIDNREQPQFNWSNMGESPYDPDNPPTPPTPVLPDNWNNTTEPPYQIGAYPLPNHWYITTPYALTKMLNAINDVDLETLDKNLTFGLNPIDGVLQIKHVYCNRETAIARTGAILTSSINIGELQLSLSLLDLEIIHTTNINWIYTFDSVTSYPVGEPTPYNDFRAYMPYSSAAFYDAFCGIVEIDPAKILNKYISIRQTVDFLSGDKITSLYASEDGSDLGERIAVLTGNCSHDIPINGLQTADYARNKYMLQKGIESTRWERVSRIAMGLAGASISAMTENVIGAAAQTIGTMANSKILETQEETQRYLMEHTVPSVSKIQNGTSNVEAGVISGPTLFMYLPRMDDNYDGDSYNNLTGHSGYRVVKPSELSSGIHIFANPKISISGTKNEAIMLTDQLKKGIIIK